MCRCKKKNENKKRPIYNTGVRKNQNVQNFIENDLAESLSNLYNIRSEREHPIKTELRVQGKNTVFEIDSGSPITAISVGYFQTRADLKRLKVYETPRVFKTYSGGKIVPKGII